MEVTFPYPSHLSTYVSARVTREWSRASFEVHVERSVAVESRARKVMRKKARNQNVSSKEQTAAKCSYYFKPIRQSRYRPGVAQRVPGS